MMVHKWEQTSFRAKEFVWEVAIEDNSHPKQAKYRNRRRNTIDEDDIHTFPIKPMCDDDNTVKDEQRPPYYT
jgi:hypothetical protein